MALRRSLARERRLARVDDLTGVDLGNRVGDDLVRSAAAALRGALRATDMVARLGRDEFIALLPETTAAAARIVLEKLRAGLAELRLTDGRPAVPSIGGVTFLNPPRAVEEIIRATDEKLLARARTLWVPINPQTGRPKRVSAEVREIFSRAANAT